MNEQDYELLSQYLDNELTVAEAQALRKRLLAEPALRANFENLRKVNDRVKHAFDLPGIDAVPARVVTMLENAPTHTPLFGQRRTAWGLAVAASLLAASGILLVPDWQETGENRAGPPVADAMLAGVLEHAPSRGDGWDILADGRQVRPLLSFSHQAGNWCREYLVSSADSSWRGVACRTGSSWTIEVRNVETLSGSAREYRPAGATDSDQIASFISTHAADIPLSLKQEAALIARQWQ